MRRIPFWLVYENGRDNGLDNYFANIGACFEYLKLLGKAGRYSLLADDNVIWIIMIT